MNMLSKIKDAFTGDVYDILGKPQGEEIVSATIYQTDKYWVKITPPSKLQDTTNFFCHMGELGSNAVLASGYKATKKEAYNEMLAEYGELRNKYK
jgi:hypothetical protein